jgi:hypothetical protein
MNNENNDQMSAKSVKNINYITVQEGIYQGVTYKINNAEVIEKDGEHFLKFDYDVKGLEKGKEKDFENYLGDFIINALKWAVEQDKINDGNSI